ncbi:MAG: hypothetical protein LBC41_04370, partial [Clostridiales bacterium]|nr:hypothetical protein [Clostridiales bacterium]
MLNKAKNQAEQFYTLSLIRSTEKNFDAALEMTRNGLSLLNKNSSDLAERRLYSDFLNQRFSLLESRGDQESKTNAAEEATKYYEQFSEEKVAVKQMLTVIAIAQMHAYLGNMPKALFYANKVNIDSPEFQKSDFALPVCSGLFRVYVLDRNSYELDRFRQILVIAKDCIESAKLSAYSKDQSKPNSNASNSKFDPNFSVNGLMETYVNLAIIDLKSNLSLGMSWSDKGWALAEEVGIELCDIEQLFTICLSVISYSYSLPFDRLRKWCFNMFDCLKIMVASGKMTARMAGSYVVAQQLVFSLNPSNDFIVMNPFIFLEAIDALDPQDTNFVVANESWLCGFWLSRNNSWSTPQGRKAYRFLSKALRVYKLDGVQNSAYAHALGLVADAHLAQGKTALAVDEFT